MGESHGEVEKRERRDFVADTLAERAPKQREKSQGSLPLCDCETKQNFRKISGRAANAVSSGLVVWHGSTNQIFDFMRVLMIPGH